MRLLLTILFFSIKAAATDYYVSTSGSNSNSGLSSSLPKQTLSAVYAIASAGDNIYFKRGDVFPADYYLDKNNMSFGAYGTGANPVFSGWLTVSSWTNEGGGLYSYTDASLPTFLNVVSFNGAFQPKRTNPTYITFQSHTGTGTGTITSSSQSGSPSLVGAELVIRKRSWVLDRALITAHSGGTLTYGALSGHASSYAYTPFDGYGYYIQNHISALTSLGDWMYDGSAKKITMYFGGNNPSNYTIKLSKTARFAGLDGTGNTFTGLDFSGFNNFAFSQAGDNLNVQSCNFSFIGETALYCSARTGITFNSCTFSDMPSNAISGDTGCDNWTVSNNTFTRIGNWSGMGGSGDNKYIASYVSGANQLCEKNTLTDIGLYGIYFRGDGCIVRKNLIQNFCKVKDDGGGIYTYDGGAGVTHTVARVIEDNVIINGVGAAAGTTEPAGKAFGIYLDERSSQITVQRNTIMQCQAGMFLNNATNNSIKKNIIYNTGTGIRYRTYDISDPISNIVLDSNIIVSSTGQYIQAFSAQGTSLAGLSSTNNKYLVLTVGNNFATATNSGGADDAGITFAAWKSGTGTDGTSVLSTYSSARLEYNTAASPLSVALGTLLYTDAYGSAFTGTQNLPAYSSRIYFNPVNLNPGKLIIRRKVKTYK